MMKLSKKDFLDLRIVSAVNPNILNIKNHSKIPYINSIQILTNNFKLDKISDIISYWNKINYMYYYYL